MLEVNAQDVRDDGGARKAGRVDRKYDAILKCDNLLANELDAR